MFELIPFPRPRPVSFPNQEFNFGVHASGCSNLRTTAGVVQADLTETDAPGTSEVAAPRRGALRRRNLPSFEFHILCLRPSWRVSILDSGFSPKDGEDRKGEGESKITKQDYLFRLQVLQIHDNSGGGGSHDHVHVFQIICNFLTSKLSISCTQFAVAVLHVT